MAGRNVCKTSPSPFLLIEHEVIADALQPVIGLVARLMATEKKHRGMNDGDGGPFAPFLTTFADAVEQSQRLVEASARA